MALSLSEEWEVSGGDLKVHEKVGVGRTATVYRGTLRGRDVAVKEFAVVMPAMSASERKNLEREIAIMKGVAHPHLVTLVGIMSVEKLCLIMEFCRGGCLFDLLHNRLEIELEWWQQVKMLWDVALAMRCLHGSSPQIIHRDLKSLNLLLAEPVLSSETEPLVKVTDFGQSRLADRVAGEVMTQNVGTQHWSAPEVLTGDDEYDEKVDVYSYSMILFEVICREVPYDGLHFAKVAIMVMRGQRPDLDAVPPECPLDLHDLMVECWSQDPTQRPPFERILTVIEPVKLALYRAQGRDSSAC